MYIAKLCGIKIESTSIIEESLGMIFAIILMISIMYPVLFKFGTEKSRLGLSVVYLAVGGLGVFLFKNFEIPKGIISFLDNYYLILFPILSLSLLIISFYISNKIYIKKEF